ALEDLLARAHRLLEWPGDRGLVRGHADAGEDDLGHARPRRIEQHRGAAQHTGRLEASNPAPANRRRCAHALGQLLGREPGVALERLDDPDVARVVELGAGHSADLLTVRTRPT